MEIKSCNKIVCNSHDEEIWDIVVVYEDLKDPYSVKCKNGGLLFISGEPPMISMYGKSFLNQFDAVLSCHRNLPHKNVFRWQQSLPWMTGLNMSSSTYNMNVDDILRYFPLKTKTVSTICSFKKLIPGHKKRNKLIVRLIDKYPDIELFGKQYKYIEDKKEALEDYMFHICIENMQVNDYWTEKIADPFLSLSVPIYVGCPNIDRYFDRRAFFECKSINDIDNILNVIFANPRQVYERMLPYVIKERSKIINEYNIYPTIKKVESNCMNIAKDWNDYCLFGKSHFKEDFFIKLYLKIKRSIVKLFV